MRRFSASFFTLAASLLLGTLGAAQAQVGQKASQLLSQPQFKAAKAGAAGTYTFSDGASVVLNERAGYLLGATVVVAGGGPSAVPVVQKVAASSGTATAQGLVTLPPPAAPAAVPGAARAAELVGLLTGLGEGISQPMAQFMARPDVVAALPKGLTVGADPYSIAMKTEGRALKLTLSLAQADPALFAATRNFLPARKTTSKPVVMRVYSDFQCPFCLKFESETMPGLLARLPDDVQVEFHQFPLEQIHPLARASAEASECAAQQGKFWAYKEELFADRTWLSGNPNTTFIALADKLGLKPDPFKNCLAVRGGKEAVDAGIAEALKLGVNGTPTVFVGNYRMANPYDVNGLLRQIEFVRATSAALPAAPKK